MKFQKQYSLKRKFDFIQQSKQTSDRLLTHYVCNSIRLILGVYVQLILFSNVCLPRKWKFVEVKEFFFFLYLLEGALVALVLCT